MSTYQYPVPVFHKKKVPFAPNFVVPRHFIEWNKEVLRYEEELNRYILRKSDYVDLLVEAWSTNVHRSVSIEGSPISAEEVRRLTRNSLNGLQEHTTDWPSQEVLNHLQVYVSRETWGKEWSVTAVQDLHRFLMGDAPPEVAKVIRPGELRTGTERSEVTSRTDPKEVLFLTAPGNQVREELQSLLHWLNTQAAGLHPLVAGALFFHEFESIHPFEDGNGRTGRVLFQLYLQTHGLPNSHRCLIEQEMMRDVEVYYDVLAITDYEYSQAVEAGGRENYTILLDHFTRAILASYQKASEKCRNLDVSKDLNETSKRIIVEAKRLNDWFTLSQASQWVSGASQSTVSNYVNALVKMGVLDEQGNTKGRRFIFADPLRTFQGKLVTSQAGTRGPPKPRAEAVSSPLPAS